MPQQQAEGEAVVGGLRCVVKPMSKVPGHIVWGPKINGRVETSLDANPALGSKISRMVDDKGGGTAESADLAY